MAEKKTEQAKFIKPSAGERYEGVLVDARAIESRKGDTMVPIYEFENDADGKFLVGERHFLKELRPVPLGSTVAIEFTDKVGISGGSDLWLGSVEVLERGTGKMAQERVAEDVRQGAFDRFLRNAVKPTDDLPF